MRKSDAPFKFSLLTASVVLLASSTWAIKKWERVTATAINGLAFYDCNANGIRDNNESTFAGIPVTLTGRTTAGDSVNVSTTTNAAGNYSFMGLAAGQFVAKFAFPSTSTGLNFTTKNTAPNGSDANPNGATDPLSIDGLTDVQGIDVGIIDRTAPVVTFVHPTITPYANGDTITVECDNLPTMNASWATAQDNSGAPVTVQFIDLATSINDCARTGYITILDCIFRATDACGNVGEKVIFVKIKDSKAPVLTGIPADITVNTTRGERIPTAASANVIGTDNCSANPVATTVVETEVTNTCGKIITRTWSASDDCGNIGRGTQRITVISNTSCQNPSPIDTFRLVLGSNTPLDTCFNLPTGSIISNIRHCGTGLANATITLTASNCIRVTPSVNFVGRDTFCARVCDVNGQNCRDITFMLNVQALRFAACNILSGMNNINLMPLVCGENACYCIVGQTDIRALRDDYTVTDNGRPYDGGYSGCQFDTIFSYNYFVVPQAGANGPYRLDAWAVNGTTRQIASFQTMQQLADSMNLWDPMGNWRVDATRYLIFGGDMRSTYGQMRITRLSNGAFGVLELNRGLISNGVKLCFSTGSHTIIFQNNVTGCADTLRANVFCDNSNRAPIVVNDRFSTPKNTPIRLAVTLNDTLNGVFQSLVAVNQPSRGRVGFQNAQTFLYTPNTDFCGRDTFDYQLCNAFGLCTSGRVFITVTCDTNINNARRPVAIDDAVTTRLNTSATFTVLANDTLNGTLTRPLSIVRFQMHGSVSVVNNQIVYTPVGGFCNGRDSFDYEICNANGCDTARVVVNVTCESDTTGGNTRRPVAVDDVATTRLNTAVTISPLANDTLNGTLTRPLSIVRFQTHGSVNVINNQILYTPTAGYCNGRDSFDYEICTLNGCDTGRVVVNITCNNDTTLNETRRPVALDDNATTRLNVPVMIDVLANDTIRSTLIRAVNITRFQNNGTVNVVNNGILYTPNLGFCGDRDTFDYEICNANGCDTARVIVNVTCENDGSGRPVAVDDRITTRLDTRVAINVLRNDILNGTLTRPISVIVNPKRGLAVVSNNQLFFTPNAQFCGGNDTLDYVICNAIGCDTASVVITITCGNDTLPNNRRKPVAIDDRVSTRLNTSLTITPLTNDTLNGILVRPLSIIGAPNRGMAFAMSGQIIYMPTTGFCGGNDTLNYEICNSNGCDTGQIIVSISCDIGLQKPLAVDDTARTRVNTAVTIDVLANDTRNGTLTAPLSISSPARHGSVQVVNNQIVYTPTMGYCGANDTLEYEICNINGCDTGRVIITISCDNALPKPLAVDDLARTRVNRPVTVDVLANDTRNGTLTGPLSISSPARHGSVQVVNNQIVYTPTMGYCGANDTLDYQICNANGCDTGRLIVIIACDSIPNGGSGRPIVAVNDNISTRKNTSITFRPTLNDTVQTRLLSLMVTSPPRNGTIAFRGLDTLLYTPLFNFCGRDTIAYTICDTSFRCADAFIFISVNCDTTVADTRKPMAQNDFVTTQKGRALTISVLRNDSIYGTLTRPVTVLQTPRRGLAVVQNNQIVYTPNATFCGGQDSLLYEICNANGCDTAKVYIAVTCDTTVNNGSNRPIVAVNDVISTRKNTQITFRPTVNDTIRTRLLALMIVNNPLHGTVGFTGLDTLVYVPNRDYCGRDTFEYSICDTAFNCANAFIYVNVACDTVNPLAPIAVNDTARTGVNQAVVIGVLANDTLRGVLARPLSITVNPRFGTARVDRNNQIVYTPQTGFCGGRDTLSYEICNANGCATALVSINVVCDSNTLRRLPVAVPDYVTARKRTPIRISILTNDTLNGTLDSIRIINAPRRGIASIGADNVLTYSTDTCGFRDTLIYRICNRNGCDTALVAINVPCQTDTTGGGRLLPIAINDTAQTLVNQPITISVLQNDTLNGVLTGRVGIITRPRFGFALVNGTNQIVYTPQNSFCGGRDTLTYEICNANGCDTAIVSINVVCDSLTATRPPVAVFDAATTRKNTPIRIAILTNDTLNGTLDSIKIIRSPLLGMASLDRNNILTYTPDSCGFTDSLIYRICNRNGCDTAIVFIKVTCDTVITNLLPPVAVFDTARTAKGVAVTIRVTLNDTLRGADTFRITRRPLNGLAIFDASRQIAYTPNATYCGNDTLIYEICNTRGCDTAIVFIKVVCDTPPPVLKPVAVDDNVRTTINRQVDFIILGNDTLRGARSAEMVSPPSHGTIIIMPDSMAMYKPDKEFCGRDSFMYRICNAAGCDTALVRIEVSCGDSLQVFRGFSPNGDKINDVLVIRGIENYPDNEVLIFNRWGNQVFTRKGYRNEDGWDGSWNEKFVPDGTYFYFIKLNDPKNQQFTGYVQLIR